SFEVLPGQYCRPQETFTGVQRLDRSARDGPLWGLESSMPAQRPVTTSSTLRLQFADVSVEAHITVPAAPVEPAAMLPALYGIVNDVVATGERRETAAGHTISCRKGCGACCRQLVPVSPVEAQAIRRLVGSL